MPKSTITSTDKNRLSFEVVDGDSLQKADSDEVDGPQENEIDGPVMEDGERSQNDG